MRKRAGFLCLERRDVMIGKIIIKIISYGMMFLGMLFILMTALLKAIGIKEEE